MPFVLRQVTPVRLSRLPPAGNKELIEQDPRQYITNQTLTACLRQLASLVTQAADIFNECQDEASAIHERTERLRQRLNRLTTNVEKLDSRTAPIPEGDLAAFSNDHKTNHFKSRHCDVIQPATGSASTQVMELKLITPDNRPRAVVTLYEKALPLVEPVAVNRPDSLIETGIDAADYGRLLQLGATLRRRRKQRSNVLEIETRRPASLAHLRGWLTDDEAVLDDLASTVGPDNQRRLNAINSSDAISHRLPSPEEMARVAASQVFTAQVIEMDVTGSGFQRMTQFRRSLQQFDYAEQKPGGGSGSSHEEKVRRKSKKRASKKRRNTIACDGDRRDIQSALTLVENGQPNNGAHRLERNEGDKKGSRSSLRERLNLMHLLRTSLLATPTTSKASGTTSGTAVTSSDMSYDESDTMQSITTDATSHASSELVVQVTAGNFVTAHRSRSGVNTISRLRRLGTDHSFVVNNGGNHGNEPVQAEVHREPGGDTDKEVAELYELIPSEKEFGTLGNSRPLLRAGVKMRGLSNKENNDGGRSSSGNWSASGSSCSTRASLDSDHPRHHHHASPLAARQKQQHQLDQQQQPINRNVNASTTAITGQRSLSPVELDADSALSGDDCSGTTATSAASSGQRNNHELLALNGADHDMETSSVYSCDAEGYYTSFHIDSGLKTLKEGQIEGTAAPKSHLASTNGTTASGTNSNRSSGLSSASSAIVENEYELFGKGSTLSSTTTSSAGTVIFRPMELRATGSDGSASKRRNSRPPEPPPRNGSNRSSTATIASVETADAKPKPDASRELTEAESREIADALEQLRKSTDDCKAEAPDEAEKASERILAKSQIERIPSMCAITPSPLPSDDERLSASGVSSPVPPTLESAIQSAFLQHVAGSPVRAPRVNIAQLPALPAAVTDTQIVIKAAVVKCPADQELVALSQLPMTESEASNRPFSSAGSAESSRSSSLERKKRGARVTLDSDGKVVYSSDSLKRRKAREGHTTFEAGQNESRKLDRGTSAFRPNPIGSNEKPLSPPPYRPAPTFNGIVRTQPDGQTQQEQRSSAGSPATATALTRSDSYRMANDDLKSPVPYQRNRSDSYRRANNEEPPVRLNLLSQSVSGFAVNGRASGTGQFVSGNLPDKTNRWSGSSNSSASSGNRTISAQPMSYSVKSPMLVKQISSPGFITSQIKNGPIGRVTGPLTVNHTNGINQSQQINGFHRRISSPAMMMMTSSPLLVKQPINPNVSGRRSYGGPRVLVNPKHLAGSTKSGSVSSLNSSAGSGLDVSISGHSSAAANKTKNHFVPPSPVVRPPSTDRPSFYNSGDLDDGSNGSPLPGYQSLSPPPKLSALPMTQLSDSSFQRNNVHYNSLPARFKSASDYYATKENGRSSAEPIDYNKWLPGVSKKKGPTSSAVDTDSPDEGGFLEYNNNSNHAVTVAQPATSAASNSSGSCSSGPNPSPTPSLSSCSLDVSFTSSLNESTDQRTSWPYSNVPVGNPAMTIHSIGLVKRTSINDFKRKLLQVHQPAQRKMSAVEQLRATKPPPAGIKGPPPDLSPVPKHPAVENFVRKSPRVNYIASRLSQQQRNNRFQHSPRTDVLSSTIIEGKSEEELAENEKVINEQNEPKAVNGVRRNLSFQQRRTPTPSSGCSTPIETSL